MTRPQATAVALAGPAGAGKTTIAVSAGCSFLWFGNSAAITAMIEETRGITPFCWPPTRVILFGANEPNAMEKNKRVLNEVVNVQGPRSDAQFYVDRWWYTFITTKGEANPSLKRDLLTNAKLYKQIATVSDLIDVLEVLSKYDVLAYSMPGALRTAFSGIGIDDLSLLISSDVSNNALSSTDHMTNDGKKDTRSVYGEAGHISNHILNLISTGLNAGLPVFATGHLLYPKVDKAQPGTVKRIAYEDDETRRDEDKGGLELSSQAKCALAAKHLHAVFIVNKMEHDFVADPWFNAMSPVNVVFRALPTDSLYHSKTRFGVYGTDLPANLYVQFDPEMRKRILPRYVCGKVDLTWQDTIAEQVKKALLSSDAFKTGPVSARRAAAAEVRRQVCGPKYAELVAAGVDPKVAVKWLRWAEQDGRADAELELRRRANEVSVDDLFGGAAT